MSHPFDLNPLTLAQLRDLSGDVTKLIRLREDQDREAALEAARRVAQEMGYNLDEIHGPKGRSKVAPYSNPENPNETWSGRGRRPKWLTDALRKGAKLEDFKS